jgi:hypothetical protein
MLNTIDDDPSWNAQSVAAFRDWSVTTLNRRVREGSHAKPDYRSGPYRYWRRSTVVAQRDRDIAASASAEKAAQQHQAQREAAEHARAERQRKRAERGATATPPDTT